MTGYLARLKNLLAENSPARQTDKTDKMASVSFVSDRGRHISGDEGAEADAIEERAGLAADRVPAAYLDAWARLNHQEPFDVTEAQWRQAVDDGGLFLDARGSEAAETGWTPGELFDVAAGLVWRLAGASVEAIGADHVRLSDGRTIARGGR